MKKNRWILLTAAVLGSMLTGCSHSEPRTTEEQTVTLSYMVPGYGNDSYMGSDAVQKINESGRNVQIEVQVYSEEQYYAALKTRLATGTGPDLFFVQPDYAGSNGVASLAKAGYLEAVDDLPIVERIKEEGNEESLLTYDSKTYSLSVGRMALGVLYNRNLFAQCALEEPDCWEEFLDCCETLKEAGIRPVMMSGKDTNTLQYGVYQIAANQIYQKNPQYDKELREGTAHFTDEGTWDRVLNMFLSLDDLGYLGEDATVTGSQEAERRFREGEAGMMFASTGEARNFVEQGEDFGFFLLPANERGEETVCTLGEIGGLSIYSGSEHIDICRELLDEVFWAEIGEGEDDTEELFPEVHQAYLKKEYVPLCNQGWYHEVELVLERMLGEYLAGASVTVEEITQAMQNELEK